MMALILISALMVQQPAVDERIAAFIKGDAAAREELVKMNVFAIRPLQKARDKAPEKIDALVYELKKAAAYPKETKAPDQLEAKVSLSMKDMPYRDAVAYLREICALSVVFDRFDPADLKAKEVTIEAADLPARDALNRICQTTGLDYGFFHNVIVIGKPDRLWPGGAPGKSRTAFGPPAVERQHKTPEDEKPLKQLQSIKASLDFQNQLLTDMVGYMKEFSGLAFDIEGDAGKDRFTFQAHDQRMFDALCLLTQARDLDFIINNGKVFIATRDAIEKKIAGKK